MASLSHFNILDTRQSECSTEFCDSSEQDSALARHFWMSVQLQPHIESRLVSSDIKQRLRTSSVKSRKETELDLLFKLKSKQHIAFPRINQIKSTDGPEMSDSIKKEEYLAKFKERKQIIQEQFLARRRERLALEKKSGQRILESKSAKYKDLVHTKEQESRRLAMEVQQDIAKFEEIKT